MRSKRKAFEGLSLKGYKFVEKIGQGNWATVYLVKKISSQEMYAVKAIDQSLFKKHPTLKELINTQINILKFCKNPNVVEFIQQFVQENHQIIVLEYCDGGNLGQKLERQGKIEEKVAVAYLKQIMNGFKGLHEIKAMHRDFKAENVMLHNNSCKIVDLGFGKLLQDEEDMVLSKLGTKFTMAPQVLQGLPYDMKADIWSIGVVYYQLLFGQYPYIASSVQGLLDKAIQGPVFPKEQNISQNSKDFIEKCLTFQPSERVSWIELYNHPLIKQNKKDYQQKSLIKIEENQQFYIENEKQLTKSIIIKPISYINQSSVKINNFLKQDNRPQIRQESEENSQNISLFSFKNRQKSQMQLNPPYIGIKQTLQQEKQRIKSQNRFQFEKQLIVKQIQINKRKYIQEEIKISFTSHYLINQNLLNQFIQKYDHLQIGYFLLKQTLAYLTLIHKSIIERENIFYCNRFDYFMLDGLKEMEKHYKQKIQITENYISQVKIQVSKQTKQYRRSFQVLKNIIFGSEKWVNMKLKLQQQYERILRKQILEKRPLKKKKLLKWSYLFHQYSKYKIQKLNYQKITKTLSHFDEKRAEDNLIKIWSRQYVREQSLKNHYLSCFSLRRHYL